MLIHTKLTPPSLRSRMLFRKDLIKRLRAAARHPFIIISGPAGSGKTSLVYQWLRDERAGVLWYSLDQEDNEPDLFYRYLLAAFIQTEEQFNLALGPMLGSRQKLVGEIVIPQIIESLSDVDRKVRLILDDFHHISDPEILNALVRLTQYIPSALQLIILSRYSLPPAIDAVVIKKERLEISASDLKFTMAESEDLFKKVVPGYVSSKQIHEFNQRVEGWAAGLQLAALSVGSKGDGFDSVSVLNQAHDQVAGYLIHDILRMQPEKTRNFIFATALLDRFNPELCTEVTGQKEAVAMLARLERMNLFLIPLDAHRRWYRYHHMFSEVIRRQLLIDNPDLVHAILHKAAKWYTANNCLEDALRGAVRFGDFNFAADLMEDHLSQYMEQLDPLAGLRWISKLPFDTLNQRTLLRLHQCNFLMILMEQSKIKAILATVESQGCRAVKRYSGAKRTLCEDYIIYLRCMLEVLHVNSTEEVFQLETLSKKISSQNPFFSRAIETVVISALIAKGDLSSAENSLAKLTELLASSELMIKRIYLDKGKALIARHRGRLHRAETIIGQVQQDLARRGYSNSPMAFLLQRHMGYIYYLQNRLAEAWECSNLAIRYCEHSGLVDELMAGHELRLLLHMAAGETDQAAQYLRNLRVYAVKLDVPPVAASLDAWAARFAMEQGNLAPAVLWSQHRKLQADESFSLLFAMECLTQARLHYAQEKHRDALRLLETLRGRCLKRGLQELILQIDILRAANLHSLNHNESAIALLMETLVFSETEGYVRPFVNDVRMIAPIMQEIVASLPDAPLTPHFKHVMTACNILNQPQSLPNRAEGIGPEELTQREIEILQWLAQGARNKEIAQKAFISINTVKTHIRSILAKLGVDTRTQAILKAKEMNLL